MILLFVFFSPTSNTECFHPTQQFHNQLNSSEKSRVTISINIEKFHKLLLLEKCVLHSEAPKHLTNMNMKMPHAIVSENSFYAQWQFKITGIRHNKIFTKH